MSNVSPVGPVGPVTVTTPLGPGALSFHSMRGVEELGRPFKYVVDLTSEDANISLNDLLGHTVTVHLELATGAMRHFHGHVAEADFVGTAGKTSTYRIALRPWLWLLSHTTNCRIFQHKTTPEIVKKIFGDHGFGDVEDSLSEHYPAAEYVVQYRESDFAFVSRLLERAGIYYHFRHTADAHTLVLADSLAAHGRDPHCEMLPFRQAGEHRTRLHEHVDRWERRQAIASGKVALRDFDFERPKLDLGVVRSSPKGHEHADAEAYDYPGGYVEREQGETLARLRLEQRQAGFVLATGHANARALSCGALVALSEHPRDDENKEYLVVRTAIALSGHALRSRGNAAAAAADADFTFSCDFGVIDSSLPFRVEPTTRKPVVEGPQTAMVVGQKGGEIWTDKHGRIKVQFHWDREGKSDENSSCWVRVSQAWAGPSWGSMHVPHVGQEVIVSFLEGDPDRPIVTGRVYDGTNTPWQPLPAQQKKSYFRDEAGNYIMMDATKGAERIELYSPFAKTKFAIGAPNSPVPGVTVVTQGQMLQQIEQDVLTQINGAMTETIKKNVTTQIEGKLTEKVKEDVLRQVEGELTETVLKNFEKKVEGKWVETGLAHKNAFTAGENVEVFAGVKVDSCLAAKHETVVGVVTKASYAKEVGKNYADHEEWAKGQVRKTSEDAFVIVVDGDLGGMMHLDKETAIVSSGSISIRVDGSNKKIIIKADEEIRAKAKKLKLTGDDGVTIRSSKTVVTGGSFESKNIKDLGE